MLKKFEVSSGTQVSLPSSQKSAPVLNHMTQYRLSVTACYVHIIQNGPKVFDQFYNSIKNYKLPEKNVKLVLFDGYTQKAFSAHFNVNTLCRTGNIQSTLQFFPCASQHASVVLQAQGMRNAYSF
jgi:hypothetical protein